MGTSENMSWYGGGVLSIGLEKPDVTLSDTNNWPNYIQFPNTSPTLITTAISKTLIE